MERRSVWTKTTSWRKRLNGGASKMGSYTHLPTEQQEAESLAAYLRTKGYDFTHIANETGSDPRARARAVRMKRAGVSRGFPDYLIFANGRRIAIELKRRRGGVTSIEQREWLVLLSKYGFSSAVCHGAAEAIDFVEQTIRQTTMY